MTTLDHSAYFARGRSTTWWKLPLTFAGICLLAPLITFIAACQSVYPVLYIVPMVLMLGCVGATGFSVLMFFVNLASFRGMSWAELNPGDQVTLFAPVGYALVWGTGLFLNYCAYVYA